MKSNDQDKPAQYIKGYTEFYKLKFKVTPDVLIPRPETELLVDEVLKFLKSHPDQKLTVLDVGTGSGCIAISIAKNFPDCHIIATDISAKALRVAKQNAKFHQAENRITFLESDLLSELSKFNPEESVIPAKAGIPVTELSNGSPIGSGMTIVTNLPYIPSYRIPYLDPSVKDYEPHIALDGGTDGFNLYRKLFQQIKDQHLSPKLIIGEIDYTQNQISQEAAKKYFPNARVKVNLDSYHRQRVLTILND